MQSGSEIWLGPATLIVALLYSMVGHGGASGYLALLGIAKMPKDQMQVIALLLNLFVAGISFGLFRQAKHFDWKFVWPFLLGAAPFAALGSKLKLSDRAYFILVGIVLVWAGIRLLIPSKKSEDVASPSIPIQLGTGTIIGLLSGLVGVGGGIFLSPVIMFCRWADAKKAAATSAAFILSNSIIGLLVRQPNLSKLPPVTWILIPCGIVGSLIGATLATKKISAPNLQRVLGALLLLASYKLLVP